MQNTKLQVPVREDIKARAIAKAEEQGFSSLQEVLRLFLTGYANGQYNFGFNLDSIVQEVRQTLNSYKTGSLKSAKTGDELVKLLDSDNIQK